MSMCHPVGDVFVTFVVVLDDDITALLIAGSRGVIGWDGWLELVLWSVQHVRVKQC